MQALLPHLEKTVHPWLRRSRVVLIPGPSTPLLEQTLTGPAAALGSRGQEVLPGHFDTDAIITTAPFGGPLLAPASCSCLQPLPVNCQPTVFTLVRHSGQVDQLLEQLEVTSTAQARRDLCDCPAWPEGRGALEQGRRGGPFVLLRLVQGPRHTGSLGRVRTSLRPPITSTWPAPTQDGRLRP